MKIGVVSDTHGQVLFTRAAVQMLESLEAELIIHCGDIGSGDVVGLFAPWPTHFVFGNCDDDRRGLRSAMKACGHTCHERRGELELAGRRIGFLHGDDGQALAEMIESQQFDLVCHGHTHVAAQRRQGKTLVLNPGALYRARYHSFALVEAPGLEIVEIKV